MCACDPTHSQNSNSPCDAECVASLPSLAYSSHRLLSGTDYAITHNLTPFISMQNQYSLAYREEEREMFPTLKVASAVLL